MIGPFGYCSDISRTFHCGPGKPTDTQKHRYSLARAEIDHNTALLRPGISFRELTEKAFRVPDEFLAQRYSCIMHGVGPVDEYPDISRPLDWNDFSADGVIEGNMTLCVESYIGEVDGAEGVKLEEQVLVTSDGVQCLSIFPLEDDLTL
jgi:Xaa-Pro aminopeptidase